MKIASLLGLVLIGLACTHSTPKTNSDAGPAPCRSNQVNRLVSDFFEAFNAGKLTELDRLFANEPQFQWYSTDAPGERLQGEASDRSTLVAYFNARHNSGEHLTLRRFQFNGSDQGYGHFEYQLTRSANSLAQTRYEGKGAALCKATGSVIAVWSMGREQP
jgi:hypothetical protein